MSDLFSSYRHLPIGILQLNNNKQIVNANDLFCEIFKVSHGEISGKGFDDLVSKTDRKGLMAYHKKLLEHVSGAIHFQITLNINNIDFFSSVRMVCDNDYCYAFIENLEDQLKLKDKLKQIEMKWNTVNSLMRDGVLILDKNYKVVEANKMFIEIIQPKTQHGVLYNEDGLVEKDLFKIFDPYVFADLYAVLKKTIDQEIDDRQLEYSYNQKNISIFVNPIFDAQYVFQGVCLYVKDVTLVKQNEKLILDQQSKIVASSKLSALGEMAAGVAHEINNPLAIIQGMTEELIYELNQYPDLPISNFFSAITKKIHENSIRISNIVKSLKIVSRNSSNDPFEKHPVKEVIESTLELYHQKAKQKRVEIVVCQNNFDLQVDCRPSELIQVLSNLIGNAIDAVENLDQKWIRLEVVEQPNRVSLFITDSGKGIPKEMREKIWQPFYSTKDVGKGTGLGLSISKGLIEGHKGQFYLDEAHPNTRFVIELPTHRAKPTQAALPSKSVA